MLHFLFKVFHFKKAGIEGSWVAGETVVGGTKRKQCLGDEVHADKDFWQRKVGGVGKLKTAKGRGGALTAVTAVAELALITSLHPQRRSTGTTARR